MLKGTNYIQLSNEALKDIIEIELNRRINSLATNRLEVEDVYYEASVNLFEVVVKGVKP